MNNPAMTFFTAPEIADMLKMHPQVIARKLAARKMEGYKIGKDWRVSQAQLAAFLERHSNKQALDPERKILGAFLEGDRLKSIPAIRGKRLVVLKHLVSKLDRNRVYSEPEINDFLHKFHSDICTLRRELVVNKLMVRKAGKYKVVSWQS